MKKGILIFLGLSAIAGAMKLEANTQLFAGHALKVSYITGSPLLQILQRESHAASEVDDEIDMRAGESANG